MKPETYSQWFARSLQGRTGPQPKQEALFPHSAPANAPRGRKPPRTSDVQTDAYLHQDPEDDGNPPWDD